MQRPPTHHTHHSHSIVEQRLPEDSDVQQLIDVDLLKDGQDGHGVDGREQRGEHKAVKEVELEGEGLDSTRLGKAPEGETDEEGVQEGSQDRQEEDGADVVKEGTVGHEVAGVQDDGGQQEEEEGVGVQDGVGQVSGGQDGAQDDAQEDQEAGFGKHRGQLVVHVESWKYTEEMVSMGSLLGYIILGQVLCIMVHAAHG